jgi:thioredoxin
MRIYLKTALVAVSAMMLFAACGNAGNRKENKTVKEEKAVKELNADSFTEKVYNMNSKDLVFLGDKPAIIDFTASWCGPCQRIAPVLEELAKEYEGQIVIYKVDVDKEKGLAQAFNVSSIPAVLYIPVGGEEPVMTVGARGKERFKEEIHTLLLKK